MYQIRYQNRYEIQVIGKGEVGLCRVANLNNQIVFSGTYSQCNQWLANRKVVAI